MLHEMLKNNLNKLGKTYLQYEYGIEDADPITEKVLRHTHKKSNKRYKMKKKRSRRTK